MSAARAASSRCDLCVESFSEFTTEDTERTENAEERNLRLWEVAAADFCAQAAARQLHIDF